MNFDEIMTKMEASHAAASPGPWLSPSPMDDEDPEFRINDANGDSLITTHYHGRYGSNDASDYVPGFERTEDRNFAINASLFVPLAIAEIKRLRKIIADEEQRQANVSQAWRRDFTSPPAPVMPE
jgi:hypothetical protein